MDWLLEHGIRIGVLVLIALAASWAARRTIPRGVRLALARQRVDADEEAHEAIALEEQAKRSSTLSHALVRTAEAAVALLVGFLILGEAGFALGPLIAGAGVAGIAIGFGAQTLVQDVISGIFILFENQYAQGDSVRVSGIAGQVQSVNLRRTILRDIDGILHSIPNGEIRVSSNMTRGFARVNVNVSVGYGEDLDRVRAVIDAAGAELAGDPEWADRVLEAPAVLRVDAFEDSGIAIKVLGTVRPTTQWAVAGELRERLKAAFDREGIEIPFPHRVLIVREPSGDGDPR